MVEVHLTAAQLALVRALFTAHDADLTVHLFGSRATGVRLKKFSDLDLLLTAEQPLSPQRLGALRDAFSASDLPFRVDLIERLGLSPSFAAAIERDGLVALEHSTPATLATSP